MGTRIIRRGSASHADRLPGMTPTATVAPSIDDSACAWEKQGRAPPGSPGSGQGRAKRKEERNPSMMPMFMDVSLKVTRAPRMDGGLISEMYLKEGGGRGRGTGGGQYGETWL